MLRAIVWASWELVTCLSSSVEVFPVFVEVDRTVLYYSVGLHPIDLSSHPQTDCSKAAVTIAVQVIHVLDHIGGGRRDEEC